MTLLLAVAATRAPGVGWVVSSARNFGRQFHSLSAQSMGPIERFVLSLVLAS